MKNIKLRKRIYWYVAANIVHVKIPCFTIIYYRKDYYKALRACGSKFARFNLRGGWIWRIGIFRG